MASSNGSDLCPPTPKMALPPFSSPGAEISPRLSSTPPQTPRTSRSGKLVYLTPVAPSARLSSGNSPDIERDLFRTPIASNRRLPLFSGRNTPSSPNLLSTTTAFTRKSQSNLSSSDVSRNVLYDVAVYSDRDAADEDEDDGGDEESTWGHMPSSPWGFRRDGSTPKTPSRTRPSLDSMTSPLGARSPLSRLLLETLGEDYM